MKLAHDFHFAVLWTVLAFTFGHRLFEVLAALYWVAFALHAFLVWRALPKAIESQRKLDEAMDRLRSQRSMYESRMREAGYR